MRICVLGAGISGLSTAFYLRSLSSNCHIDIFEKESSVGGKIKTCNRHGYKLEEGASSFLCNFDNDTDIFRMLEVEDQLLDKNIAAKSIFIYDGVNISKIPFTLSELFSSPLLGIFSKIRVALEILIPLKKTQHEESVQHFGYRRFGRDFTNKIIDAISSGLFASTAEKLCMNTTFPHIAKIESSFGSIIRNTYKHKQKTKLALKTFRNGMSSLIDALMKKVSSNIYVDTEICTINKIVNGWEIETCNGEKHRYDIVVLCTPSYVASRLLKNTDSDLAAILKKIEYSPISIVSLGYKNLPINIDDGYGIFCSKDSNSNILGIVWDSTIFEDRAEDGHQLVRVIIGGQRNPFLATKCEEELEEIAIGAVIQIMKIETKPNFIQVTRWHKGLPHYKVGHTNLIEKIFGLLKKHNGLYLNSNSYKGISISDCIKNSKSCADAIVNKQR